jgi:hypothetical protein
MQQWHLAPLTAAAPIRRAGQGLGVGGVLQAGRGHEDAGVTNTLTRIACLPASKRALMEVAFRLRRSDKTAIIVP